MNEKILYIECINGISGDMTLGALIHLGADAGLIEEEIKKLNPGEFELIPNETSKNGISGINLDVRIAKHKDHTHQEQNIKAYHFAENVIDTEGDKDFDGIQNIKKYRHAEDVITKDKPKKHHDHHSHTSYTKIKKMIEQSELTENAKGIALSIFKVIGLAEAAVHKTPLDEVSFHEVGAVDSIVDIVGTAIAIDMLGIDKVYCSPVHDGQGQIECRHGIIPVPVPAVMEMLKSSDIPIVIDTEVTTEMVTPTGFGILEGLKAEVKPVIGIKPEKVGYGFGKRDTGRFNAVRIIIGEEYIEENNG